LKPELVGNQIPNQKEEEDTSLLEFGGGGMVRMPS